jgi:hypothetical protein
MTNSSSIAHAPWFAIAYGLSGISSICYGLLRISTSENVLIPVGGVSVAIALLNWFAEEYGRASGPAWRFEAMALILIVLFALTVRALSIRLMELTVADRRLAERFSLLNLFYLFLFSIAASVKGSTSFESPGLAVSMFIAVACALHVCSFAFGKSEAIRRLSGTGHGTQTAANQFERVAMKRSAVVALIVPTLLALVAQVTSRDDWRLMGVNLTIVAALIVLILIACSQRSSA